MSRHFTRADDLAHETIDGETIVIDLKSGTYYRLEGAASHAWRCLAVGADANELTQAVSAAFSGDPAEIAAACARFIDDLAGAGLIVARDAPGGAPPVVASVAPFPGLAVHRFEDLQELFLIDPVHEVDETGWPMPKREA